MYLCDTGSIILRSGSGRRSTTRPRSCTSSYGLWKSTIDRATRGSRRVLRPFSDPSLVHTRSRSPSRPTQTGTLWGDPSAIRVARCAKFGRSMRALASADNGAGIDTLLGVSSPGAEAELPQVVGDEQPGFGARLNLGGSPARGVFPQFESLGRHLEQAQVGHHQLDDARRRDGQGAALEQPGPAVFGGVLQRDEHPLGAGREIHGSTDAAALARGDAPVGEVAVLRHFV